VLIPNATFTQRAALSDELIAGEFCLYLPDGMKVIVPATSGCPGHQTWQDQMVVGKGPIPDIVSPYKLQLAPVFSDMKGTGGIVFRITPDPINFAHKGVKYQRTQILLHHDANFPGAAGCIGIVSWEHFALICNHLILLYPKYQEIELGVLLIQ